MVIGKEELHFSCHSGTLLTTEPQASPTVAHRCRAVLEFPSRILAVTYSCSFWILELYLHLHAGVAANCSDKEDMQRGKNKLLLMLEFFF